MYGPFAEVYDDLMEQVPYESWCRYIRSVLHGAGIDDGLLLDLGCGTGRAARIFSGMGYDVIGVDASEEMLAAAREKMDEAEAQRILLLNQDMRSFELYGTVRAVVSMCDTLNYCEDESELLRVFRLVRNYLDPGGLFIFDMNTAYKFRECLGDAVFADSNEKCAYIWENSWFEDEQVNQYELTLFIPENEKRELFARHRELHVQRAFSKETVRELLGRAGLRCIGIGSGYEDTPAGPDTERMVFVAQETGKAETDAPEAGAGAPEADRVR